MPPFNGKSTPEITKFCKQVGKLNYCRYCQVPSYVITSYVYFRWLRRRKTTGVEARLDKRIERARARHDLAHLVMGTIFLVTNRPGRPRRYS